MGRRLGVDVHGSGSRLSSKPVKGTTLGYHKCKDCDKAFYNSEAELSKLEFLRMTGDQLIAEHSEKL